MEFCLLGPLEVRDRGQRIDLGRPKQRALLARLLISPNQVVSADRLVDDLWPGEAPADPAGALQIQVSRLRRALRAGGPGAAELLESRKPGYVLHASEALDATRFTRLLAAGRQALADGDPDSAVAQLTAALGLWRGSALGEFADEDFARAEAARLEELRLVAVEERFEAELARGAHAGIVAELRQTAGQHQARERLWGQLVLALYRSGRQAEALRAYGELRRWLGEELGIEPSAALRALEEAVLLQRADLDWVPPDRQDRAPLADLGRLAGPGERPLEAERAGGPLIGRREPLELLLEQWRRAALDGPVLALVAGEPGVGKTRLAAELAATVAAHGALVLVGRCDDELAVPYQPFTEALGPVVHGLPAGEVGRWLGGRAAELVRLLPELADLLPDLARPPPSDPETEAFRLFEAVTAALAALAARQPVLLVLDDLHWAARPTLLLLRHIVRRSSPMALLAVGTYRDTEPGVQPIADLLGGPATGSRLSCIGLRGLDEASVAELVESLGVGGLGGERDALARSLHAGTAGNPLFVREVVRDLVEAGGGLEAYGSVPAPEGVQTVVRQRLARLSDLANHCLGTAAVLGTEYDLAVLAAAARVDEEDLLAGLEEAMAAGLVADAPGPPLRQRFTHALVKDVLYDRLPTARRARLHGRVGAAIEAVHGRRLPDHLPELARHFARADGTEAALKGAAYARQAGDRAAAQLADDEAVLHYREALRLLERSDDRAGHPSGDPSGNDRTDLLIALGEAQRRLGEPDHRRTLLDAAAAAQEAGDAERLARAALAGSRGFWSASGAVDGERVATLRAALDHLGEGATPLRARLLGNLAVELVWAGDFERVRELSDQALALARRTGDLRTLAAVLVPRYNAIRGDPGTLSERLANTAELLAVAEQVPDPSLRCEAWGWRAVAATEHGDLELAERCFAVFDRLAQELRQPTLLWYSAYLRAARRQLAGRFAEAEQATFEAFALGQAAGHPDAEMFLLAQVLQLAYERGALGDWEGGLRDSIGRQPGSDLFLRSWQALLLCELDRDDEARACFDELAVAGFAELAFEPIWLHVVTNSASVCSHLADAPTAVQLLDLIRPHADQLVTMCSLAFSGSAHHHVAMLSATAGDLDAADRHFAEAVAVHDRIGAPAWVARSRLEWARALARAGDPGRQAQTVKLLRQASETARTIGARTVERRAVDLLAGIRG